MPRTRLYHIRSARDALYIRSFVVCCVRSVRFAFGGFGRYDKRTTDKNRVETNPNSRKNTHTRNEFMEISYLISFSFLRRSTHAIRQTAYGLVGLRWLRHQLYEMNWTFYRGNWICSVCELWVWRWLFEEKAKETPLRSGTKMMGSRARQRQNEIFFDDPGRYTKCSTSHDPRSVEVRYWFGSPRNIYQKQNLIVYICP